jgi:DNA-binding NarL/FixJ family response regulator
MRRTFILIASEDELFIEKLRPIVAAIKNATLQESRTFRSALPRIRIEHYNCIIIDKNLGSGDGITLGPIIKRINPESFSILVVPQSHWATTEAARTLGYSLAISAANVATELGTVLENIASQVKVPDSRELISARQRLERLSEREREILVDISQGKRNYEIATFRHISEGTIKSHLSSIYRKLEVRNRVEAISMMNNY